MAVNDVPNEIIEEVAKVVAREIVHEQQPARTAEHNAIATRVVKFVLLFFLLEAGVIAYFLSGMHNELSSGLECISQRVTNLEYEHIKGSDFKPITSCF